MYFIISSFLFFLVFIDENFCYECNKEFKATSSYRRHLRDYHSNILQQVIISSTQIMPTKILLQFQCEFCEKTFRTRGLLINHKSEKHRESSNPQNWKPVYPDLL